MDNISNERLLLLANAQQTIKDLSNRMEQWKELQIQSEQYAFDAMNISDQVLNMSRDGKSLITTLQDCYHTPGNHQCSEDSNMFHKVMEDIDALFLLITKASYRVNEVAHKVEEVIAVQKEIGDNIKNNLEVIEESLDTAVACAEFMFSEF